MEINGFGCQALEFGAEERWPSAGTDGWFSIVKKLASRAPLHGFVIRRSGSKVEKRL